MKKIITVMAMVIALALSALAPALANNGQGNSLRSAAEPVELMADDISAEMCQNGEDVRYYAVQHNLSADNDDALVDAESDTVWREPARLGGENGTATGGIGPWNTLYLGVSGPDCGDIQHKGRVTVYYAVDGALHSITAQFNGKGELLHVNGVKFTG